MFLGIGRLELGACIPNTNTLSSLHAYVIMLPLWLWPAPGVKHKSMELLAELSLPKLTCFCTTALCRPRQSAVWHVPPKRHWRTASISPNFHEVNRLSIQMRYHWPGSCSAMTDQERGPWSFTSFSRLASWSRAGVGVGTGHAGMG